MSHALTGVSLCKGLTTAELDDLLAASKSLSVEKERLILRIGELNHSIFIIRSGAVVVTRPATEGKLQIARLGAGRTFGEMSVLDNSRTSCDVSTVQASELLELPLAAIEQLEKTNPALWGKLWRNLALDLKARLIQTNELVDHYVDLAQVLREDPSLRDQLGLV